MKRITKKQWALVERCLPASGWTRRDEFVCIDGNHGVREIWSVDGVPLIQIDVANNRSKATVSVAEQLLEKS